MRSNNPGDRRRRCSRCGYEWREPNYPGSAWHDCYNCDA